MIKFLNFRNVKRNVGIGEIFVLQITTSNILLGAGLNRPFWPVTF
jgi:hypothetical protein